MSADVIFSKRCCHTAYSKLSRFDILAVHMRNALMVRELHLPQPLVGLSVSFSFVLFLVSFSLAFWDSPRYRLFSEIDPRHAEYFCNWTAVSDVYFQRSKRGMCKRRLCKLTRGIATLCIAVTDHGAGISLCTCDWLAPWTDLAHLIWEVWFTQLISYVRLLKKKKKNSWNKIRFLKYTIDLVSLPAFFSSSFPRPSPPSLLSLFFSLQVT